MNIEQNQIHHSLSKFDFVKIEWKKLIEGQKCLIIYNDENIRSSFTYYGIVYGTGQIITKHIQLIHVTQIAKFYGSDERIIYVPKLRIFIPEHKEIYIMLSKKQKIQDAMELRALIKILQKITGDNTFNHYI